MIDISTLFCQIPVLPIPTGYRCPQRVVINEQMLREAIMIVSLSHTFFTLSHTPNAATCLVYSIPQSPDPRPLDALGFVLGL